MAQGMMTEYEWRKQAARAPRRSPPCWGAQCIVKKDGRKRGVYAAMIMLSFIIATGLPLAVPRRVCLPVYPTEAASEAARDGKTVRALSSVSYDPPEGLSYTSKIYRREELLRGKLLLLDDAHALPQGAPMPNTMSVAAYGKGMVPVSDLTVKSGKETIVALTRLFAALRGKGVSRYAVCRGTMTPLEQRQWRVAAFREMAGSMTLHEAMERAMRETDAPAQGELQQEFTVDLHGVGETERRALEESAQGVALLQCAWRCGFIRTAPGKGPLPSRRFRYVGEAHATAMTFLDVNLREYLELLHEKKTLFLRRDRETAYLIQCVPLQGDYVEFACPENAPGEVSADNMGYAVLASVIKREAE